MLKRFVILSACAIPLAAATVAVRGESPRPTRAGNVGVVQADIVATGIPGAGAIAEVGTFRRGGPFVEKAALAAATRPDGVLAPSRLFVASSSNFGAPPLLASAAGAVLSIEPGAAPIAVPADFAANGGQAAADGGAVVLFAAQSAPFANSVNNPGALTSNLTAVSLPLGISLNNGFGRPWFANAPNGSSGDGTITVIDPSGAPLAGAPSATAGGVFSGDVTNDGTASTHGLTAGAVATALATKAPGGTGRAIFLAALADGSVVQVNVINGVAGLLPAGSFTPIPDISTERAESADPSVVTRAGMVFNWVPDRIGYVSDPLGDRIVKFALADDGPVLKAASVQYLTSPALHTPIDLAPTVRESAARNFSSNTTLAGNADFYVLNRGDNSIVRMTQDGTVVAIRRISAALDRFTVNGIAVSEDARTIWVTATLPNRDGVVLRIPAFGARPMTTSMASHAAAAGSTGIVAEGADMFSRDLRPSDALGPLFNGQSCATCHNSPATGGMGATPDTFVTRVARVNRSGFFDPLSSHGGPIARQHSIEEMGVPCGLPTGVPAEANMTSRRSAPTLLGTGLIDNIDIADIEAAQAAEPATVRGRINVLPDGRPGRFGWKAQTATLVEFMGQAFRDEIGLTNALAPQDLERGCGASILKPEAGSLPPTAVAAFLNRLDPAPPSSAVLTSAGAAVFSSTGCATCHKPSYRVVGSTANDSGVALTAHLYSDLLLHDLGPALADGFPQGSATGSEFRTTPLWGLSARQHFLHDGRAKTILDAILAHGGQASSAVAAFKALGDADRQALLDFLNAI